MQSAKTADISVGVPQEGKGERVVPALLLPRRKNIRFPFLCLDFKCGAAAAVASSNIRAMKRLPTWVVDTLQWQARQHQQLLVAQHQRAQTLLQEMDSYRFIKAVAVVSCTSSDHIFAVLRWLRL